MEQALFGGQNIESRNLDAIDYRILNLLQEDCRLSYNRIATKIGVSVGTAYNRIKNLENKGLLKGYSLIIDSTKLGYSLTAIIFVQVKGGHLPPIEHHIAEDNCIAAVYDVTGEFDVVVIAKFRDRIELSAFIKHLAAEPFVKRTVTNVSLNAVKEDLRINLG